MKKIIGFLLALMTFLPGITPGFSVSAAEVKLRDLIEYNPTLQHYAILDDDKTEVAWIQNDTYKNSVVKNPIIFFNLNSATNFETITKVFFTLNQDSGLELTPLFENEVVDENGLVVKTLEFKHSVSFDEMHTANFYENYGTYYSTYNPSTLSYDPINVKHKDYEYNLSIGDYELSSQRDEAKPIYSMWTTMSKNQFHVGLPELGTVNTLKRFYSYFNEVEMTYGPSMSDSFIYRYKNDAINSGYKTYEALNTFLQNGFTHYLVLPINFTAGVNVTYLAIEGYDTNGNFISPIPEVNEGEVVDPGTQTPETLNYVTVSKTNNTWNTSNALFFGGNNVYKLRYIELTSVQYASTSVNYTMKAYLGNLLNKDVVSIDVTNLNKVYLLQPQVNATPYSFVGSSNTLIIDANANVVSFTANIYYEIISDIPTLQSPIMINLVDEEGNLGIAGLLPKEDDPDKSNWWDWINDLFGLNIQFDDPATIFKMVLGAIILILIVYLVAQIVRFIRMLFPRRRR